MANLEIGFGTDAARPIGHTTPAALRGLKFPAVSMGPKVEAARRFVAPGTEIGFGFLHHNRLFVQNILYDHTHTHTCTTSPPGN